MEVGGQSRALGLVEFAPGDDHDALLGQRGADEFTEHLGVPGGDLLGALADATQLLAWRQAVGRADRQAHLVAALEARHPNHVELVEVGGEDRQELGALEQRQRRVGGQRQHARVEVQPAQFPIEIAVLGQRIGRARIDLVTGRRRWGLRRRVLRRPFGVGRSGFGFGHTTIIPYAATPEARRRLIRPHPIDARQPDRARPRRVVAGPTPSRIAVDRSSAVSMSQRRPGHASVSSMAPESAWRRAESGPKRGSMRWLVRFRTRTVRPCPCRAGHRRSCVGGRVRRRWPRPVRAGCSAGRSPCSTTMFDVDAPMAAAAAAERVVQRVAVAFRGGVGHHARAEARGRSRRPSRRV